MFIQTEFTPNPASLKFLPGVAVMTSGTANFTTPEQSSRSPLASRLFTIDGVEGVFLGYDFITVTKAPSQQWEVMKPQILAAIMDHFTSGADVIESEEPAGGGESEDDALAAQIKELIDTRVRPAVAQDGGDII